MPPASANWTYFLFLIARRVRSHLKKFTGLHTKTLDHRRDDNTPHKAQGLKARMAPFPRGGGRKGLRFAPGGGGPVAELRAALAAAFSAFDATVLAATFAENGPPGWHGRLATLRGGRSTPPGFRTSPPLHSGWPRHGNASTPSARRGWRRSPVPPPTVPEEAVGSRRMKPERVRCWRKHYYCFRVCEPSYIRKNEPEGKVRL